MFRFTDTYVFLQRGVVHQDRISGDELSLAQKGVGQFVIFVDDLDAVRAELDQAQVATLSGPADRDWGMRTLTLADPGASPGRSHKSCPALPAPLSTAHSPAPAFGNVAWRTRLEHGRRREKRSRLATWNSRQPTSRGIAVSRLK
jgi:hypothetical protein